MTKFLTQYRKNPLENCTTAINHQNLWRPTHTRKHKIFLPPKISRMIRDIKLIIKYPLRRVWHHSRTLDWIYKTNQIQKTMSNSTRLNNHLNWRRLSSKLLMLVKDLRTAISNMREWDKLILYLRSQSHRYHNRNLSDFLIPQSMKSWLLASMSTSMGDKISSGHQWEYFRFLLTSNWSYSEILIIR